MQNADDEMCWKDLKEEMLSLIKASEETAHGLRNSVDGLFFEYGYYSRFFKKLYSYRDIDNLYDAYCKIIEIPIEGNEKVFNDFLAKLEKQYSCNYNADEIKSKLKYYLEDKNSDYSIIDGMGKYLNH